MKFFLRFKVINMISLTSTWEAIAANGSSNPLQASVRTISERESENFKFDADSMIDFESCAQLTKPSNCNDKKCNITISSTKGLPFSRLIIISESKRAEILDGNSEEYKFTKQGELLDDSDPDMIMFKMDIILEKPCSTSIKVHLTGIDENCWLLGAYIFLLDNKIGSTTSNLNGFLGISKQTRFDLEEMNSLLKTSELSDKAQSFKSLFETFQKTGPYAVSNQSLNSDKFSSGNCDSSNMSSDISSTLSSASSETILQDVIQKAVINGGIPPPDKMNIIKDLYLSSKSVSSSGDFNREHKCCEQQSVISQELKDLEAKVFKRIEEMEKRQEEKLNQILDILSKSTL